MLPFDTPILFLIFNRPETTRQVFERIRTIRPKYLFIAADGPRPGNEEDLSLCTQCRNIVSAIDWDCELHTLFKHQNLGCGTGPAQAITWFFEQVEQGIILEDDCLPDQSFFPYCELLLKRYRDESSIMHIGGNNFQRGVQRGGADYYFSIYNHIWGWATWRRAWNFYNKNMDNFNKANMSNQLSSIFKFRQHREYWLNIFERCFNENPSDIWDYQWTYTIWNSGGIAITPQRNLVSNIGFGAGATHTTSEESWLSKQTTQALTIERHPEELKLDFKADLYTSVHVFDLNTRQDEILDLLRRIRSKSVNLLKFKHKLL